MVKGYWQNYLWHDCISGLWSKVLVKVCDCLRCIPCKKPSSLPSALQKKAFKLVMTLCHKETYMEKCFEQLHHSVRCIPWMEKTPPIGTIHYRFTVNKPLRTWSHFAACSRHYANTDLHTWPQQNNTMETKCNLREHWSGLISPVYTST